MHKLRQKILERVSIDSESGCWNWIKSRDKDGYGRLWFVSKTHLAHRLSYKAFASEIQTGLNVLHHCDNPSCVNPDHLFLGTNQDNMDDKRNKGRCNPPIGTRSGTSKITEDLVIEVRKAPGKYKDLSQHFGISPAQICRIKRGYQWSHVPRG